jgi:hypothetical protein
MFSLDASSGYEAMRTWVAPYESSATQLYYREDVERLMLWPIAHCSYSLSSAITEDVILYRMLLRHPSSHGQ